MVTPDAKDVVFFMHGILDTSLGWVSNGVAGSSAFAAYDAGFDVWLGNSRANPPFEHEGASIAPITFLSHTCNAYIALNIHQPQSLAWTCVRPPYIRTHLP